MKLSTVIILAAAGVAALGCGGRPADVADVDGLVLLEGQPLAGAMVQLRLKSDPDTSFMARTDDAGEFQLMYGRGIEGATIGSYQVLISTRIDGNPEANPPIAAVAERLPETYWGPNSPLSADIVAGENHLKFKLLAAK